MSYCRIDARGRVLRRSTTLSGLGFSLKIPRKLRKFQPGVYIRKHPLILAALAVPFIPGVAPLLARGATGAARLGVRGGRGLFSGARGLTRGAAGLLKRAKLPTNALKEAANFSAPLPAGRSYTPETPAFTAQFEPVSAPAQAPGGAAASSDFIGPPAPASESPGTATSQAGPGVGLLALGGLALLALFAGSRPGRARGLTR